MKKSVCLILLGFFISGCELPGLYRDAVEPTSIPIMPQNLEAELQKAVEVRWSISAPMYQTGMEAGSTASIDLMFSPSILQVIRRSDGSISQTISAEWNDHPVSRMRWCVALDQPCSSQGDQRPFEPKVTTDMKLDWLGARQIYLSVEFYDRAGKPISTIAGWDVVTLSRGTLVMDQTITTVFNPAVTQNILPSSILTAAADERIAFPVTGSVKIEGSPCCRGGAAGSQIRLKVIFQAESQAGEVTDMRIGRMCSSKQADLQADWEPFVTDRTFATTVPLNWTTFTISVQYRDAQGNLSNVYCDNLGIEGSPLEPTT